MGYELDYNKVVPFEGAFYGEDVSVKSLEKIINKEYELIEVMAHPAYVDSFLLKNSSYNLKG